MLILSLLITSDILRNNMPENASSSDECPVYRDL